MTDIARSPKQIGALIRKHRRARDLNQTELGAKTSLRQATISNYRKWRGRHPDRHDL